MFAASMEGLTPEERAKFDQALAPRRSYRRTVIWSCRTCAHTAEVAADRPLRALSPAGRGLRSVPSIDPERVSAERLAAIIALGGDIDLGSGA